jgi:hypothetical protein
VFISESLQPIMGRGKAWISRSGRERSRRKRFVDMDCFRNGALFCCCLSFLFLLNRLRLNAAPNVVEHSFPRLDWFRSMSFGQSLHLALLSPSSSASYFSAWNIGTQERARTSAERLGMISSTAVLQLRGTFLFPYERHPPFHS